MVAILEKITNLPSKILKIIMLVMLQQIKMLKSQNIIYGLYLQPSRQVKTLWEDGGQLYKFC